MAELSPVDTIARARIAMAIAPAVKARAWRVERLGGSEEVYYLVVFGEDHAATAVCAINANTAETMVSARLGGVAPHLAVDSAMALQIANAAGASAKLVWSPCQASLSPLYPFWEISGTCARIFIDQQGKRWDRLSPAHA